MFYHWWRRRLCRSARVFYHWCLPSMDDGVSIIPTKKHVKYSAKMGLSLLLRKSLQLWILGVVRLLYRRGPQVYNVPMIVVDVESNVKITRLGIWRSLKLEKLTTGEKINLP